MKSLERECVELFDSHSIHFSEISENNRLTDYANFSKGFYSGVAVMQDRAQVLVEAIEEYTINNYSYNLDEAVSIYKKSMETK